MMKAMDSIRGQGANHSNARRHCEDLQRSHRVEGALSCFEISGSEYQAQGVPPMQIRISANRELETGQAHHPHRGNHGHNERTFRLQRPCHPVQDADRQHRHDRYLHAGHRAHRRRWRRCRAQRHRQRQPIHVQGKSCTTYPAASAKLSVTKNKKPRFAFLVADANANTTTYCLGGLALKTRRWPDANPAASRP